MDEESDESGDGTQSAKRRKVEGREEEESGSECEEGEVAEMVGGLPPRRRRLVVNAVAALGKLAKSEGKCKQVCAALCDMRLHALPACLSVARLGLRKLHAVGMSPSLSDWDSGHHRSTLSRERAQSDMSEAEREALASEGHRCAHCEDERLIRGGCAWWHLVDHRHEVASIHNAFLCLVRSSPHPHSFESLAVLRSFLVEEWRPRVDVLALAGEHVDEGGTMNVAALVVVCLTKVSRFGLRSDSALYGALIGAVLNLPSQRRVFPVHDPSFLNSFAELAYGEARRSLEGSLRGGRVAEAEAVLRTPLGEFVLRLTETVRFADWAEHRSERVGAYLAGKGVLARDPSGVLRRSAPLACSLRHGATEGLDAALEVARGVDKYCGVVAGRFSIRDPSSFQLSAVHGAPRRGRRAASQVELMRGFSSLPASLQLADPLECHPFPHVMGALKECGRDARCKGVVHSPAGWLLMSSLSDAGSPSTETAFIKNSDW